MGKTFPAAIRSGRVFMRVLLLVSITLGLTTCDAFKAGLGPKIDISGPTVNVKSIPNGAYLKGTVVLSGDDIDVVSMQSVTVVVSINSVQVAALSATLSAASWSASLDTKALTDKYGDTQANLDIKVVASSGKTTDEKLVVYLDNTPPVFTSMTPSQAQLSDSATYDYALSQEEAITGSVNDFGLNVVELDMGQPASIVMSQTTKSAFSFTVDSTKFFDSSYNAQNNASKVSGTGPGASSIYAIPYQLIATDFAGNKSTVAGNFYVKPGPGAPIVTFVNPSTLLTNVYFPNVPPSSGVWKTNTVLPSTLMKFSVFDMDGLDLSDAGLYVAIAPGSTPGLDNSAAFNPSSPPTGYIVYTSDNVTATNRLTVTPTTTLQLPGGTTIIQGVDVSFSAPSTDGQYAVLFHVADSAANKLPLPPATVAVSASRDVPVPNSATNSNPDPNPVQTPDLITNSRYLSLFVSDGNPTVSIATPNDGAFLQSFAASGSVHDNLGISQLQVTINTTPVTTTGLATLITTADPSTPNWTFACSPTDGTYTASFVGFNNAGAQTTPPVTHRFTIDTTPPTVTIALPGGYTSGQPQYWLVGATTSLQGSAADPNPAIASGVAKVYYKVDVLGASHASDSPSTITGTWALAAGTTLWSVTENLGTLGEGQFTLWTAAYDNVGNLSSITSQNFGVDQSPPTLTETNHPATSFTKSTFTLAGSVGDTDALASLSITEKKNGVSIGPATFTSTPLSLAGQTDATYDSESLPLGGVADGSYSYVLTATDIAGKTTIVNRTVNIDTTPPTLNLNAIPSWISSAAYTISGFATDPNLSLNASGVAAVQYQLDGGAWTTAVWTDTSGGGNTTGTWNATLSGLAEGNHSLIVRATDAAGNTTTLGATTFGVDLNPPNLTAAAVPATVTAATGASFTGFSGTLYDTNPAGLASLVLNSTQNGAIVASNQTPTTYTGSSTSSGNPWTYAFAVDTTASHATDGLWTFTFTATDVSGKTATVVKNMIIDTQPPTTTVTAPSSGAWVSSTSLSITGAASDATGTGVSKVYVKADGLYVALGSTDHSAEDPANVANGWTTATGQSNWSASLTLAGEGRKTLWIKAVDAAGNLTTAAGAVASRVDFGLDINPPTLGFSDATGAIVNSAFSLAGSTDDTNPAGPPTLAVSVDGGASQAITVSAKTWTFPVGVDASGHANDGPHTYLFTASDVAGKTTTQSRSITIDTIPATATISSPVPNYATNATSLTISGSATDGSGSGVKEVWYAIDAAAIDHSADVYNAAGWAKATGATLWSVTVSGLTEGSKKLWVKVVDNAGNVTTSVTAASTAVPFVIDLTPPTIAESNIGTGSVTRNAAFTFGGAGSLSSAADALSGVNTLSVTDNGANSQSVTVVGGNWTLPVPVDTSGHTYDGTHTYVFTLTDKAGNSATLTRSVVVDTTPAVATIIAPAATLATNAASIAISGSANDGAGTGVAQVWFAVDAAAVDHSADVYNAVGWTLATGTTVWSSSVGGLTEGNKKLWVKVLDNAGNVTANAVALSTAVPFAIDRTPPTLTETSPVTTASKTNASFTFGATTGVATDALSGIQSFTVSDNGAAAVAVTPGASWTYPVAVDTVGHGTDGSHTYLFTAVDKAGNQATMTRTIVVDTIPATATITSPVANLDTNAASVGVSGSANDGAGTGVAQVWYDIDAAAVDHSADAYNAAGWTQASGTTNWSATAAGLTEGNKKLWVKVLDNAGNVTANAVALATAVPFVIDRTPPSLSETSPVTTAGKTNASFTFGATTGVATDALSGIQSFTVSDNGAAAVAVTPGASWTYAVVVDTVGHGTDGSHTYLFTAVDKAGNQATMTRTIVVDTIPATATITSPVANLDTNAASVGVSGSANDGAGTGVAQVWYDIDAAAVDHSADAYNAAGWTQASGTTNWSATAAGLTEGNKKLWVKVLDNAGNVTANAVALATAVPFVIDRTPPSLSETSPVTTAGKTNASFTFGATTGVATDALSGIQSFTVSDNGATAVAVTPGASWTYAVPVDTVGHGTDGSHTYLFTAVDKAGNQATMTRTIVVDTIPATATVISPAAVSFSNSSTLSLSGAANDGSGSGVSQVWFIIDAAANDHSADAYNAGGWAMALGGTNWSATVTGLAEGNKKLWVKVLDNAGNVTTNAAATAAAVPFTIDLTPPVLTEGSPVTTAGKTNSSFAFGVTTGAATDALAGVQSFTVSDNGATAVAVTPGASWTYPVAVDTAGHTYDGTHTYLFTLTDKAGNQSTIARTIVVDTTPAIVTVNAPVSSGWINTASATLSGSANDGSGSGVSQVWFIIDVAAADHSADAYNAGGWTQAVGTTTWHAAVSGLTEGGKKLWVKALDNAGNVTTNAAALASVVPFGVDLTPPALTVAALGGYRAPFAVNGTVSDASSGVSALQIKIDSASFNAVAIVAGWTYAVPAADFSALSEGPHTITVLATDAAGNQTTQAATFNKDTTPPTLSFSNISAGGGTVVQDTSPVLTGILTDVSGVASAIYTLQAWNYATQAWNAVASGATLGAPGGAASWNWSLDLSASGLSLPDGKYQAAIGATDTAGNAIAAPIQVPFFISRASPGTSISAPSLGTFQNAAFPLTGTASDPNGLTLVRAKIASGAVDFSSGSTAALPALPATVATGSPGVFTTNAPHALVVGDSVYIWGTPMPATPAGALATGTSYVVQSATATTFTIATSGAPTVALAITTSTATNVIVASSKYSFPTFHPAIPVSVSGSTMTATNHQLANGDVVYFQGTSLPAPTAAGIAYYVVNSAANAFQVSTTSGGSVLPLTTSGTSVSVYSPSHPVNWLIPAISVSSFVDGALTAYVQDSAGSGKTSQTSRDFTLDTTAPTIGISSPSSGTRTVGNLTLVGTTNDGGAIPSGVTGTIQYQIGNGYNLNNPASWTSANVTGGSYSWSISLGDMSGYANATYATQCDTSGNPASGTNLWKLPIVFQAFDRAGNVAQLTSYYLILDPNGNVPVITITQPATGLTFGGQQTITGTATQPVAIYGVEVAVDPNGGSNFPANPVPVTISGATLTSASHPFTAGMMVFLSGTTAPQIGGTSVLATTPYWVVNPTATTFQVSATSGGSPVGFSSAGIGVTASVWAQATLTTTGNNVIWYYNINTTAAYPQNAAPSQTISLQARAWNSPTVGGPKGTISGLLTTPWVLTFNSSFPQVQNVLINGQSYYSQITNAGTVGLTATISSSKGIAKLESVESSPLSGSTAVYNTTNTYAATAAANGAFWSSTVTPPATQTNVTFANGNPYKVMITAAGSNSALWTAAGAPATAPGTVFLPNNVTLNVAATGGTFIESDAAGNFDYTLSMTINSNTLYPGTTGQYVFNIRATDMTSPVAEVTNQPITLDEDNYYPTSTIASSATIVGSQFVVQGSATDSGTGSGSLSGFSKVVAYFVRAGSVLNLSTGANGSTTTMTAKDMNNGGTVGSVTYPGAGSYLKLSIDSLAENNSLPTGGGTDVNGDGFMESLTINGSSYTWMGQIDSTKLADGPVELHCVVFDSAGNATHYVQSAFVSNNAPVVSSVVLGTDITGSGTITPASYSTFSGGYATTGFTAINKRLYFQINTLKGNGALSYSLKNGGNQYWGTTGTTVAGNAITVNFASISPPIADATGNAAQFVLTVTDSTPGVAQSASVTIGMNIQNNDVTPPVVTVNPLYWTDATHNSIYQGSSANGHVDLGSLKTAAYNPYSATAPYSLPTGLADADPKVSGAISFTGTVSDNQRIGKLTIQIGNGTTGYDFGNGVGVAYDVAAWNGTNLVGVDQWTASGWRLTISNEVLGITGHTANWQLDWNSAKLNTVAGANVVVSVKATDASSNVATPVPSQIDVVPYITSLTTKITSLLSSDFARTASGQYPVLYNSATTANSESFLVNGFNLKPTTLTAGATSDIRLSKLYPSGFNNAATPVRTGVGLAGSGVNAACTQLTVNVQQAALGNGYLTVITNGLPSINNVNDSSQAYDTETNATVATMTDARYLSLWDITLLRSLATYANGASYVSMAMNGNTPEFAYSNNTYGYGINFFHNGTTEQEIYENWNFMTFSALALNSNGSRAALYDVNVASQGVQYTSDWGGIMLNAFYNPQASAWNNTACFYRAYNLWLDDLFQPSAPISANLDRYQFPDISAIGADANTTVFYSVYDQIADKVLFRTFNIGNTNAAGANNAKGAQASNLYTNLTQLNQNGTWPTFVDTNTNNGRFSGGGGGVGTNNNSGNTPGAQTIATGAGPYTAVAATSGGSAILVYYQSATNKLVYTYNDTPTNSTTWSTPTTLATLVGGNYVHMKVDASNHVHIAYYDSFNGGVKYIYVPTYNAPSTNTQVVVDNYLTAGDKLFLTVDANGKPYISYKGIGNTGKVAWLAGGIGTLADGVNASKQLTGVWEVQVIPNAIVDSDSNRFEVGVGSTTLRPVVGYTNNNTGAKGIEYLTRTADLAQ